MILNLGFVLGLCTLVGGSVAQPSRQLELHQNNSFATENVVYDDTFHVSNMTFTTSEYQSSLTCSSTYYMDELGDFYLVGLSCVFGSTTILDVDIESDILFGSRGVWSDYSEIYGYLPNYLDFYTTLKISCSGSGSSWTWVFTPYLYINAKGCVQYVQPLTSLEQTVTSSFGTSYSAFMFNTGSVSVSVLLSLINLADSVSNSYTQGYEDGYGEGYTKGMQDYSELVDEQGQTATIIFAGIMDVALLPINFFLACLNFEVFGINIGAFVSATLTVCIVVIIFRTIFGKGSGGSSD